MDSITLKVKINHSNKNLVNLLNEAEPVDNVNTELEAVDKFGDYKDFKDVLLISDDAKAITPYLSEDASALMVIFAGEPKNLFDDLTFFPANLLNVWPSDMPDKYIKYEFNRAMALMLQRYDAWLYKSWLISLIDSLQDLIWFKDKEGLHWLVNNKFENTVHKTRKQIHGMGHNYIWDVPPEDGGKAEFRCLESEREVMAKKSLVMADELVKTDIGMRHFMTYKAPLYGRDGDVVGTVGIGHDITDFNNTSLELSMLIDNIPMSIMICNEDWKAVQINRRFSSFFGIAQDKLEHLDYHKWKKDNSTIVKSREYDEKLHIYHEELAFVIDGESYIIDVSEQEVLDYFGNVTGHYCFYKDITADREYEAIILKHANTDALTGLYNRRYFFDFINAHRDEAMTVLFMDMDNFKKVNDTLGHKRGDEVLLAASTAISQIFKDCVVARVGGDEFTVLAGSDISNEELTDRSDTLVKRLEEEFSYMGLGVSLSIGMAHTDGGINDVDDFLHESDQMMYKVKQGKKKA